MIYYAPQDYIESYRVPFKSVSGDSWKVSIQEPSFEGSVTELLGAEFPVEWEGNGDESQDEVIFGSTGKIRIICRNDNEKALFTHGNILPTAINDRRVQVMRYVSNDWIVYWQGFIVPATFSQDWDATPYEIELPIVSVVASMEYFPMPLPTDNCYAVFEEQTNIAGLLRAIFAWCGCTVFNVLTNKREYENFNGETQIIQVPDLPASLTYNADWTQGVISPIYFYENDSGILKPKTFKDVLETLCYPYGKVQDYGCDVYILMRWKDDANTGTRIYQLPIWYDFPNAVYATDVRLGDYEALKKIDLEDINTAGTDNTHSILLAPRSVKFSSSANTENGIFELSENFIKSSLPIGDNLTDLMANEPVVMKDFSGKNRYLYAIDKQHINLGCAEDWDFTASDTEYLDQAFCRVVEVTGNNSDHTFSVSTLIPLGLCFNLGAGTTLSMANSKTIFTIPTGVRTFKGANLVKMTVVPYVIDKEDPTTGSGLESGGEAMSFYILDTANGKCFRRSNSTWGWSNTWVDLNNNVIHVDPDDPSTWPVILGSQLNHQSGENEFTLFFNEDRETADNSVHKLRIGVRALVSRTADIYIRMYCSIKFEYVDNKFMYEENGGWTYSSSAVLAAFAKNIKNNAEANGNTGGDADLDIEFKTRCGNKNLTSDGIVMLPYNSFCDATKYIDTEDREQIEIEAAQFERYYSNGYFDLITKYAVVKDGSKVFIPVAVGMNPRMNTLKLALVSTNVTSDQPVPPTPQNPEIAWSAASASATIGGTNTFPTLSNPHSLPITYASSDTSVATVDSSGVVTLVAAGSANISASFAGSAEYYASTVTYALAVEAALPYDAEIEYLENPSTCLIDADVSGNVRIVGRAVENLVKGSSACLLCSTPGGASGSFFGEGGSSGKWGLSGSVVVDIAPTTAVEFDLTFDSSGSRGTIQNQSVTRNVSVTQRDWKIFANGNRNYPFAGKLYYLKIYKNNVLTRDFIPVRIGTTGYMYDTVSGELFGNAGTSSFTLGPDKN